MEELHPRWEVLFFSDGDCRDFVRAHCPAYADLYDWYPRAVLKADFFRVLAVYQLGGFYFDSDVWLVKNLEPLRRSRALFPWEWEMPRKEFTKRYPPERLERVERWQVGNYAFGAEAGHPFLRAVLDEMVRRTAQLDVENCTDLDVLQSTGPDVVTTVYYRHREHWTNVEVMPGAPSLPGPQPPVGGGYPREWQRFGSYGTHLLNGGWLNGK